MKKINFTKKDFILIIILGVTLLVVNYALNWYEVYKEHNLSTAIISKYLPEITIEEFQNYIQDNPSAFIYFGINDDDTSREFENKFKKTVTKYHLKDEIIYFNSKNLNFEEFYLKYSQDTSTPSIPTIIYFEDKEIVDSISYKNNKYSEKDVVKFLRKYDGISN